MVMRLVLILFGFVSGVAMMIMTHPSPVPSLQVSQFERCTDLFGQMARQGFTITTATPPTGDGAMP